MPKRPFGEAQLRVPPTIGRMSGYGGTIRGVQNHFGKSNAEISALPDPFAMIDTVKTIALKRPSTCGPCPITRIHKDKPGYTGFVRSNQHYLGCTYGESVRQADRTGVVYRTGPKYAQGAKKTLPSDGRLPGYTGFIQSQQERFGESYSKITKSILLEQKK